MKKYLIRVSLVVFSLVFTFFLLEVIMRVGHFQSDVFGQLDQCLGWKRIPNKSGYHVSREFKTFIEINNEGFRDVDHKVKKEKDVFRILFLGDSFTEAMQVPLEKTHFRLLETKFSESDQNIEVISLGVASFGTNQALLSLECYGLKYKPDLVILDFFANDVRNNYFDQNPFNPRFTLTSENKLKLDEAYKINVDERMKEQNNLSFFRVAAAIKNHSHLARFLVGKINNIRSNKKIDRDGNRDHVFDEVYSTEWIRAWNITKALIEKIDNLSRENGAEFLLVNMPTPVQMEQKEDDATNNTSVQNRNKPNDMLLEVSRKKNIRYIDLLPFVKENIKLTNKRILWEHDGHLNEYGNQIVADFIFEYIIENDLHVPQTLASTTCCCG